MTAAIHDSTDTKSHTSYKSTPSSRSSVLEKAREFTRSKLQNFDNDDDMVHDTTTPRSQTSRRSSSGPTTATMTTTTSPDHQTVSTQQQSRPSLRNHRSNNDAAQDAPQPHDPVVSPELLVDALSGHEDGLLAIAERLMEHYDRGYDAMGEAIIDAFADVQKLFQHVVEAAHMEGAAFEASRREEEMQELRKQAAKATEVMQEATMEADLPASPAGPVRHDEFIDQDVKDCLNEAIREGAKLKEANKHLECFELYERACQSASALLPVDSDHRGRLQLSIARADSMSPDRGCAILRYAMDDVLRSGLRAGKIPLPDPSKRADVVLSKPKAHPSMNGLSTGQAGVVQSTEEQLNSLVEEMKEILEAPVYKDTPLQDVAKRFWVALQETQKLQNRNEERLEQNLGKLKGEFLLARAEWEEKLNRAEEQTEQFKQKYLTLKAGGAYMDEARNMSQRLVSHGTTDSEEKSTGLHSLNSNGQRTARGAESIASLGSSMAHHARTLVGQFNCTGVMNERMGPILASELAEGRDSDSDKEWRDRRANNTLDNMAAKKAFAAQSQRYYAAQQPTKTQHRSVDV